MVEEIAEFRKLADNLALLEKYAEEIQKKAALMQVYIDEIEKTISGIVEKRIRTLKILSDISNDDTKRLDKLIDKVKSKKYTAQEKQELIEFVGDPGEDYSGEEGTDLLIGKAISYELMWEIAKLVNTGVK